MQNFVISKFSSKVDLFFYSENFDLSVSLILGQMVVIRDDEGRILCETTLTLLTERAD